MLSLDDIMNKYRGKFDVNFLVPLPVQPDPFLLKKLVSKLSCIIFFAKNNLYLEYVVKTNLTISFACVFV